MINLFGMLFLLAGFSGATGLYLLTYHPLVTPLAQVVYLIPSVYFVAIGAGLLRRRAMAYHAAATVGMFLACLLGGGSVFLIPYMQALGMSAPAIVAVCAAVLAVIVLVSWTLYRARQNKLEEQFTGGSWLASRNVAAFLAIVVNAACIFLVLDATSDQYALQFVQAHVQRLRGQETADYAAGKPNPVAAPTEQVEAHDPNLPPGVPGKTEPFYRTITPTPAGEVFWLNFANSCWICGSDRGQLWNPATGVLKDIKLPASFSHSSVAATSRGLLFVGGNPFPIVRNSSHNWSRDADGNRVMLVPPDGKPVTATLAASRAFPRLLAVSDSQVLAIGGIAGPEAAMDDDRATKQRSRAVELITLGDGSVSVERLPDLPGTITVSYGLVVLADGRLLVVGGTDSPYVGCWKCSADTHILNVKTRTWSPGPKLNEARADASATLLPDGSVLVAGGYTPTQDWQQGGTRTTERWDGHSSTFATGPQLPAAAALLRTYWAPGREGKQLLLAGGTSGAVQLYDVASNSFRMAGEWWGSQETFGPVPVAYKGQPYLWLLGGSRPFLVSLRMPFSAAEAGAAGPAADFDHKFYRAGLSFLPGRNDAPSLALGGAIISKQPTYRESGGVEAIWPDGRVQSLAPLNHSRVGAHVFRLADGSVLVAGGERWARNNSEDGFAHLEWLPAGKDLDKAAWVTMEATLPADAALSQFADGSLVAVSSSGTVERITVTGADQGKPGLKKEPMTQLELHGEDFKVKALADGRVIVVGGVQQTEQIALLDENSSKEDGPDTYVGFGPEQSVDTYQIYDPKEQTWHSSAPSDHIGSKIAILDDGRVVSLEDKAMAISSADGGSWRELPATDRSGMLNSKDANFFAWQGELFISGGGNGHTSIVQWYDFAAGRWVTIWQLPPGDDPTGYDWVYSADGRIISRQLANGKRVTLPINGN
jgi:hypothetical protein